MGAAKAVENKGELNSKEVDVLRKAVTRIEEKLRMSGWLLTRLKKKFKLYRR